MGQCTVPIYNGIFITACHNDILLFLMTQCNKSSNGCVAYVLSTASQSSFQVFCIMSQDKKNHMKTLILFYINNCNSFFACE